MKNTLFLGIIILIASCQSVNENTDITKSINQVVPIELSEIEIFYNENVTNCSINSVSSGSVSNGTLENGTIVPHKGENFQYFDTVSYISERGYTNCKVKATIIDAYKALESNDRLYQIMECSNKNGGKMFPHKTHQNGLSVDFMMPLIKGGLPYYKLDTIGHDHYWLEFDDNGNYIEDKSVSIDFNAVAEHILVLDKSARANGLKISKVIIKIELKDELFSSENGKVLKKSGIYIVKGLTPIINSLHDEHYHIDFEVL